ncbi:hypothetical protein [Corynebacterium striatum]|uniref:hypothetical protein n=1 Tax=Corynebacterium striatum TaxID=43770 RepID=UPI003AEDD8EC
MEPQTSSETTQPSALQRFAPIIALGILLVVIVASTITLTSRSSDNVDLAADTIRLSAPATTSVTSSSAAASTSRSANPETEPATPSDDAMNQNRSTLAPEPLAPAQRAPVQQAPAPAAPPLNYQTWDDDDDEWDDYDDDWDDD